MKTNYIQNSTIFIYLVSVVPNSHSFPELHNICLMHALQLPISNTFQTCASISRASPVFPEPKKTLSNFRTAADPQSRAFPTRARSSTRFMYLKYVCASANSNAYAGAGRRTNGYGLQQQQQYPSSERGSCNTDTDIDSFNCCDWSGKCSHSCNCNRICVCIRIYVMYIFMRACVCIWFCSCICKRERCERMFCYCAALFKFTFRKCNILHLRNLR